MSHRIPQGIEGITGFRASSPLTRQNCLFWQNYCHFWQYIRHFQRFEEIIFGFHRVSRVSEGFTGFHRVSSAESASRHIRRFATSSRLRWTAEQSLKVETLTCNRAPRAAAISALYGRRPGVAVAAAAAIQPPTSFRWRGASRGGRRGGPGAYLRCSLARNSYHDTSSVT